MRIVLYVLSPRGGLWSPIGKDQNFRPTKGGSKFKTTGGLKIFNILKTYPFPSGQECHGCVVLGLQKATYRVVHPDFYKSVPWASSEMGKTYAKVLATKIFGSYKLVN